MEANLSEGGLEASKSVLLSDLNIFELREELSKRGSNAHGVRAVLVKRLIKAIEIEGHDPDTHLFSVPEWADTTPQASPITCAHKPVLDDDSDIDLSDIAETDAVLGDEPSPHDPHYTLESPVKQENEKVEETEKTEEKKDNGTDGEAEKDAVKKDSNPTPTSVKSESRSLWVRGISSDTKASDLKSVLSHCGTVVSSKIFVQRGAACAAQHVGYVTMLDEGSAVKCVKLYNKVQYNGCVLTLQMATKPLVVPSKQEPTNVTQTPSVGKEPTSDGKQQNEHKENGASEDKMVKIEQSVEGESIEEKTEKMESGIDKVKAEDQTTKKSAEKQSTTSSQGLTTALLKSNRALWVRGIGADTKAAHLKRMFSKCGRVGTAKVFVRRDKPHNVYFGFLLMASQKCADRCVQLFDNAVSNGARISVQRADQVQMAVRIPDSTEDDKPAEGVATVVASEKPKDPPKARAEQEKQGDKKRESTTDKESARHGSRTSTSHKPSSRRSSSKSRRISRAERHPVTKPTGRSSRPTVRSQLYRLNHPHTPPHSRWEPVSYGGTMPTRRLLRSSRYREARSRMETLRRLESPPMSRRELEPLPEPSFYEGRSRRGSTPRGRSPPMIPRGGSTPRGMSPPMRMPDAIPEYGTFFARSPPAPPRPMLILEQREQLNEERERMQFEREQLVRANQAIAEQRERERRERMAQEQAERNRIAVMIERAQREHREREEKENQLRYQQERETFRLEQERKRIELVKAEEERARAEQERAERERVERERVERERAERERVERERAERERIKREQLEQEEERVRTARLRAEQLLRERKRTERELQERKQRELEEERKRAAAKRREDEKRREEEARRRAAEERERLRAEQRNYSARKRPWPAEDVPRRGGGTSSTQSPYKVDHRHESKLQGSNAAAGKAPTRNEVLVRGGQTISAQEKYQQERLQAQTERMERQREELDHLRELASRTVSSLAPDLYQSAPANRPLTTAPRSSDFEGVNDSYSTRYAEMLRYPNLTSTDSALKATNVTAHNNAPYGSVGKRAAYDYHQTSYPPAYAPLSGTQASTNFTQDSYGAASVYGGGPAANPAQVSYSGTGGIWVAPRGMGTLPNAQSSSGSTVYKGYVAGPSAANLPQYTQQQQYRAANSSNAGWQYAQQGEVWRKVEGQDGAVSSSYGRSRSPQRRPGDVIESRRGFGNEPEYGYQGRSSSSSLQDSVNQGYDGVFWTGYRGHC